MVKLPKTKSSLWIFALIVQIAAKAYDRIVCVARQEFAKASIVVRFCLWQAIPKPHPPPTYGTLIELTNQITGDILNFCIAG